MGAHFLFECASCSYQADISGGNDVGMASATSTVLCKDCKELYDVVTTHEPWLAIKPTWKPTNLRCPKSETHEVALWEHSGLCPRCGAELVQGEVTVLWD